MRKQTIEQIRDAVATLENFFLNPYEAGDDEPMTIESALAYVEEAFNEQMDCDDDKDRSVRFDGKEAIREEMKRQILASQEIKVIR